MFEYPNTLDDIRHIKTGRSSLENFIKIHYPWFYLYLQKNFQFAHTFQEKVYDFYNNITESPKCAVCGGAVKFHGYTKGYSTHCCAGCKAKDKAVSDKIREGLVLRYGENFGKIMTDKCRSTCLEIYGDRHFNNPEKRISTCRERYGCDSVLESSDIQEKIKNKCKELYGTEYWLGSEDRKRRNSEIVKKSQDTCMEMYGTTSATKSPEVKLKISNTVHDRYGVDWACQRKEIHGDWGSRSKTNNEFAKLLSSHNIDFEQEFVIGSYIYDFKVGNILVGINPSATHNITWSPYGTHYGTPKKDKTYHLHKTLNAEQAGYRVLHVWDWDRKDLIVISQLLPKTSTVYARDCVVKEVTKNECDEFLKENHLQGTCNGQSIRLGLYDKNFKLVQIMTFGKSRYSKNYEFELLRLCTSTGYVVLGGSEKIFRFFIKKYNPKSIISYCDRSKFTGDVYKKLGFVHHKSDPTKHWYNIKTKKHITNTYLLKNGADRLLGTSYGKGSSNDDIMKSNGFVEIYDCGQDKWVWENISYANPPTK